MEPYTAQELIAEQLADTLDQGKKQNGAGTGGESGGGGVESADISAAKTQVEADTLISKHLMQKGLVRGTKSFADEQKKIRDENNVSKLPIK